MQIFSTSPVPDQCDVDQSHASISLPPVCQNPGNTQTATSPFLEFKKQQLNRLHAVLLRTSPHTPSSQTAQSFPSTMENNPVNVDDVSETETECDDINESPSTMDFSGSLRDIVGDAELTDEEINNWKIALAENRMLKRLLEELKIERKILKKSLKILNKCQKQRSASQNAFKQCHEKRVKDSNIEGATCDGSDARENKENANAKNCD